MHKRVPLSLRSAASTAAIAAFMAVSLIAAPARATLRRPGPAAGASSTSSDSSTFNVGYFDIGEPASDNGTGAGDNLVHLINPTAANGNLCAMIYMFDDDQEIGACCGCPLSPNKLLTLSVENDLISNWALISPDTDNGTIKIVSAMPNVSQSGVCDPRRGCNGGCDPTQAYMQTPALVGSILRPQTIITSAAGVTPVTAVTGLTETNMFQEGVPDEIERVRLVGFCDVIIIDGSGHGSCGCGPEGEGPLQALMPGG
jgi:hypothetical protein